MEHKKAQEKLRAWMDISAVLEALAYPTGHKILTEIMVHRARLALHLWGEELDEQTKHLEPQEREDEKR
jgi:hypothetical protein